MDLTERAEIRKETFYKLTNSRNVPEAPKAGGRNLLAKTNQGKTYWAWAASSPGTTAEDYSVNGVNGVKLTRTTDSSVTWQYIRYDGLLRKLIEPGTNYTLSFDVNPSVDVTFTADLKRGDGGGAITNWAAMNKATANQWTKVSCTLASKSPLISDQSQIVYLSGMPIAKGNWLIIKNIKLEKGDTATPYTPAPEDLGWSIDTLVPTPDQRYLWKFEYIYYSDGSVEVTQPTNISVAGVNGQTSHVHFAFADNATGGGFSLTTPKAYMGWYADFNEAASTDPTKYRWSKWKGDQGAPGKPGADGKTSYFHMAYAESADGRTGFSFKESGQQYQGYYTDFTQTSSTDPTKYAWMDRRAGVEVGSKNLLRKTAINAENLKLFGKSDTTVSVVEKDGHQVYKLVVSGSSNAGAHFNGNSDYYNLVKDRSYTFSFWVLTNKDKTYSSGSLGHIQAVNNNSDKVGNDNLHQHTTPVYSTNTIKANTWTKVWCTFKATSNSYFKPYFWYLTAGDEIYIYDMMLNEGTIPLSHSLAPEDSQEQIDSKADQTLTQEQLNALAEKNSIIKAEMEAKASVDTVDKWITAYENYVKANDADKAKSEQALKEASERIVQMKYEVNDLKLVWESIDRFMSFQNEGLVIGKKDGSAYAKFSDDRISLFSGSSEVMYISQGTLNIANGIFTKTIQIGRFRFETHPADADMLVLRYLGG